jgi:signal-transduction protein with cAMP-binding, CBS, and nucleotidyltransferase domain
VPALLDAIRVIAEKGVGALLVMDGQKPVGIISERDYVHQVILKGRSSDQARVDAIMTTWVSHAEPDQGVEHCLSLMTKKRIRHLPVMQDGEVVGVLSLGDLVKAIISEQKLTIDHWSSTSRASRSSLAGSMNLLASNSFRFYRPMSGPPALLSLT